ncbi:hypothetical protein KC345_g151 [Hortaea werneckii]|nr:hypothetical protein KC345_g151 [Hortaea werneckii]
MALTLSMDESAASPRSSSDPDPTDRRSARLTLPSSAASDSEMGEDVVASLSSALAPFDALDVGSAGTAGNPEGSGGSSTCGSSVAPPPLTSALPGAFKFV